MVKRVLSRLLGIIVILAIAYTGASWYIGQQAEQLIHNRVALYQQQLQQDLPATAQATLAIDDYQRHVFSSDARYTLTLTTAGVTRTIQLADHLVHGPLPYTQVVRGQIRPLLVASNARLLPSVDTEAMFAARTDKDTAPVTVRTTLTFRGGGQSVWQFQPLASAQDLATFSGGTAMLTLSNNFQDATLQAEFAGFKIDDHDAAGNDVFLQFQDIAVNGATAVAADGTQSSQGSLSIGQVTGRTVAGRKEQIKNTRLAFSGSLAQGQLDGQLEYNVGQQQLGPLDLGSFDLQAHVENIDFSAAQTLQQLAVARADGDSDRAQQARLRAAVNALLAAQPVVAIDRLHWQMPAGTSDLTLNLHFLQPQTTASLPLSMQLANAVDRGELHLSLSKPMLAKVLEYAYIKAGADAQSSAMRVQMLIYAGARKLARTGLFIDKDDVLKTDINYQDQTFKVNGEQLLTGEFIARVFALSMGLD